MAAPTLCFSLMAAAQVVSGGTMGRTVASYCEVALPDLAPGVIHKLVLEHVNPEFRPRNRAWLPLGAYLRVGKACLPLPPGNDLGVRQGDAPPPHPPPLPLAPGRLPLVPQPTGWRPSNGTVAFTALAPLAGIEGALNLADRLGLAPLVSVGGQAMAVTKDTDLGPEAYRLTIAPDGLAVTTGGPAGLHYAAITLLSLRATCGGHLPCGMITDQSALWLARSTP